MLSLIVATKGRASPFGDLFASLEAQDFRDFEVIVVDQNADDRVGTPETEGWSFPVLHLRTPRESGASHGRNTGFARARGSVILFPDDDCWYDPGFLSDALRRMGELEADVLSGRAADASGRDINGRYLQARTTIARANVWTAGIEWVVFFRREVFAMLDGFDPGIGIGAETPWQSCEAQDIMLRAIGAGYRCVFDPAVFGHHAELDIRSPAMLRKGRAYARGFGFVLRRHRYPLPQVANWLLRPAIRGVLSGLKGDRTLAAYYGNVLAGRFEGWRMRVLGRSATAANARFAQPATTR